MYDVVVVGAGPAGSAAARRCAGYGLKTLIVEEHATIGYPIQCAGLLSVAALEECGVSGDAVVREVSGASIISSMGSVLTFDAGVPKAYVVDRGVLDREMAQRAVEAGADIRLKTYACGISDGVLRTKGVRGTEEIRYRMLIAADGPRSPVSRMLGLARPPVHLSGVQAEVPYEMDGRHVEIYPDASPDFFGWAIPVEDGRARIGLCGTCDVPSRFAAFSAQFGPSCMHQVTGTIPLGQMPRTYGHRTLFIGDAAGLAKPTSGGGVYTGVRSGCHAADTAMECCGNDRFDDAALEGYESRWKKDFGRELDIGMRFFRIRPRVSPQHLDEVCRTLNTPGMKDIIVRYGDMDRPGTVLKHLLKNPAMFRVIYSIGRSEIGRIVN
ncbi:geranylgeranyl reductase [Methanomicrobiaceae archaeon CYW5]|uniref:NAD(P)/FAD-dependent oxidoreductase n=1 Tax=Methanovulcanius yangii TaxID=1789227 RepID=UPI0029C9FF33|nr:NAD(P)/FAD-dependent oxidoreductase [Methanovulcanius yangii]MBT8507455.1 geranylgeranyl reductase [Methanovulcanius yangii]